MENKNYIWRPVSEYTGGRVLATNGLDVIIGEINSEGDCESEDYGCTILCGITGFIKIEEMLHELKKDEGEMIRKALINFLHEGNPFKNIKKETRQRWIAWLEKQGEQKHFAKYKVGDTIYYNSFGSLASFVISNIVEDGTDNPMYEDKDGNSVFQNDIVVQKPADKKGMNLVEEEMTPFQKEVFCIIDTTIEEEQGLKQVCDKLLALASNEIKQNDAWSEEDEENLNWFEKFFRAESVIAEGRDIPQDKYLWLKSLKDRYTWKPSDEQIEALNRAMYHVEDDVATQIAKLIGNLKKLRGE